MDKNKISHLRGIVEDVIFLKDRGLIWQTEKLYRHAKKLTDKYNHFTIKLELLEQERICAGLLRLDANESVRIGNKNFNEQFDTVRMIKNAIYYKKLLSNSEYLWWQSGIARKGSIVGIADRLLKKPHMLSVNRALTLHAKIFFYSTLYNCYIIKHDILNAYHSVIQLVELWESHMGRMELSLIGYISSLHGLAYVQMQLGRFQDVLPVLKKLRTPDNYNWVKNSSHTILTGRILSYHAEICLYVKTGDIESGLSLIPEISKYLLLHAKEIPLDVKSDITYFIAYLYMEAGDYKKSLKWLNILVNEKMISHRINLYSIIKIMMLLVHYELGNDRLLEYIGHSTYRFLYKQNRLYKVETAILEFIRKKASLAPASPEMKTALSMLKLALEEITRDPYEKRAMEYFDFISWLESKITGRPFAEIVRSKAVEMAKQNYNNNLNSLRSHLSPGLLAANPG